MRRRESVAGSENGQALILFTLALCVLLLCAMSVVDVGFFLHNRENAQQAADAAALAGSQDLPGNTIAAQNDALSYITKNGLDAANTTISFKCTSQIPSICTSGSGTYDTIVVTQKAPSPAYFGGVLGILGVNNCWVHGCTATATAAGCRGACAAVSNPGPLDVALVLDDTGTMHSGCTGSQQTQVPETGATNCPVAMARLASRTMLNNLFPAGGPTTTQVGLVRFRGCYGTQRFNPVPNEAATRGCVLFSEEHSLAGPAGKASLNSTIDTESAVGGFPGTNICTGLDQGSSILFGAGSQIGAKKVIVLITDGDNRYSDGAEGGSTNRGNPIPGVLPTGTWSTSQGGANICKPGLVPGDGSSYGSDYDSSINQMDTLTNSRASTLKSQGVEIYVVRFADPPGDSSAATLCNNALVGQGSSRDGANDTWDRNLTRCIASSTSGTNDHYFYAPTPDQLPVIFSTISTQIAQGSRLVGVP
jgi:Flp pilus assembly protein TadG